MLPCLPWKVIFETCKKAVAGENNCATNNYHGSDDGYQYHVSKHRYIFGHGGHSN